MHQAVCVPIIRWSNPPDFMSRVLLKNESTCVLQLVHKMDGEHYSYEFLISLEDADAVSVQRWYFHRGNRSIAAKAMIDGKWVKLHRWVIKAPSGTEVDHQNRNPYDCRRENLRLADRYHQERNKIAMRRSSTGMRGVIPRRGRYEARIQYHGKRRYIGTFNEAWHARLAYVLAEWKLINDH